MGRRRKIGALVVAVALGASLLPRAAMAAGGFTIVMGGANPLHALGGSYNAGTYVSADIDGDGDLDIVVREPLDDTAIEVLRNDGGSFTLLSGTTSPFAGISFPAHSLNFLNSRVLVGDFDADGDVDLWHHAATFAAFYRNDGATFSEHVGAGDPLAALGTRDPGSYVVVDVDADGDPDVVAREPVSDASLELFRNDGGTFTVSAAPFAGVTFAANAANFLNTNVLVLDADRDGDVDLWHKGVGVAELYRNDGATFSVQTGPADPLAALAAYDPHSYAIVDADGDGDLDVVAREPVSQISLDLLRNDVSGFALLSGGASPFVSVPLPTSDFESMYLIVGDHDADGDIDVYNQALNELYVQAGSAPRLTAVTPAHGATDVAVTSTLTLTFDEPVTLGSGTITLRRGRTGALIERLRVGADAARFAGSGTTTITVMPNAPLPFSGTVTVAVDAGAFVSSTDGDAFAGVGPVAWRFSTAANTPPGLTALDGDTATFVENGLPIALDSGSPATVTDADGLGFAGGELTVAVTNAVPGEDRLVIDDPSGVGVLTQHGSDLSVALGSGADATALTTLVRTLVYVNDAGDRPTPGERHVTVVLSDGHGASASATVALTVVAVNDPPAITTPGGYMVSAGSQVVVGSVTVSDVDDDSVQLQLSTDAGAFGNGQRTMTIGGTPAEVTAAVTSGALTWHAPLVAAHGQLHLVVDDGEALATATIELTVHAAPPPPPSPTSPLLPPPTALQTPSSWEDPIAAAAQRPRERIATPTSPSRPNGDGTASDGSEASEANAPEPMGSRRTERADAGERSMHVLGFVIVGLFLFAVFVVARRRRRDER